MTMMSTCSLTLIIFCYNYEEKICQFVRVKAIFIIIKLKNNYLLPV